MLPDEFANEVRARRLEAVQEMGRFLRADADIWEALRDITRTIAQELGRQPERLFGPSLTPKGGGGSNPSTAAPPIMGAAPNEAIDNIVRVLEVLKDFAEKQKQLVLDLLPRLLGL